MARASKLNKSPGAQAYMHEAEPFSPRQIPDRTFGLRLLEKGAARPCLKMNGPAIMPTARMHERGGYDDGV
jgi:hypothetical protein